MRIFQSPVLPIVAYLLCLSSPIAGAPGTGDATDTEVEHGPGSGDTAKDTPWSSFLNPSRIVDSIKSIHLPSSLNDVIHGFIGSEPTPSDFWKEVMKYEKKLQDNVPHLLEEAGSYFGSTAFTDVTSTMHHIVEATTTFRDDTKSFLDAHNITIDMLAEELEGVFTGIATNLVEKIPPTDKAPGHAERKQIVDKFMDDTTQALLRIAARYEFDENIVHTYLSVLEPKVEALIVAVGDINEQHPQLLPIVIISVIALLIPEGWILKPFLRLFGFGPAGPVKGSVAAWAQRTFWGAAVESGSWFSWLQAAAMAA